MVLGLGKFQILIYAENHGGSYVGRAQSVTSAHDERLAVCCIESILHIEQQRFSVASRFLCTVEDSNTLASLGNSSQQMLHTERTIQVNADHTILLAVGIGVIDGLAGSLGGATHQDNNLSGILCTVI